MMVIRPARLADLDQIERMAASTDPVLHSLPPQRDKLHDKLVRAAHSFEAEVDFPGEETYVFVLEDTSSGRLRGICSLAAAAGFEEPFYAYRNDVIVHASHDLGVHSRIYTLTVSHELTSFTQLASFYIDADLIATTLPPLLSLSRLMFIAQHPERFAEDLVVSLPGVTDDAGRSPFWENVGRKFFGLDFLQAEFLSGGRSKPFIAELMPHHPLYVPLLSPEAQAVMGQVHPRSQLPWSLLSREGFESDRFIDIFDAGPVMCAKRSMCRTVRDSRLLPVRVADGDAPGAAAGEPWLVANDAVDAFRATLIHVAPAAGGAAPEAVTLRAADADALGVESGDTVRGIPLPAGTYRPAPR
ncbi:Arginine N-succinyltransferase [Pandoraea terrae]|uniref:Arginine N-succinyltransferase n=1 Tax=Pandoraea terrae TaxID=1537710 RepID=A0A5E4RX58_9BURK|nr:arginine N-succinyltransferase [Pandoraea terrae]VVD67857.1 Arginine N-succinyltransferase [Pandoraea terrae]